jgi:hypothetical protein
LDIPSALDKTKELIKNIEFSKKEIMIKELEEIEI